MTRYLTKLLTRDLAKKAILLSGPRQVGKTTLAKEIAGAAGEYLNYDILSDRKKILAQGWRKDVPVVVLDEIHKFPKWKNFLKGVIDEYQNQPRLLVTGSARLETFRRAGDALTGRTFAFHLHPIDVAEACQLLPKIGANQHLSSLISCGGFPESFYDPKNARRFLRDRLMTILREDLRDLSRVTEIKTIELLVELLRDRVGGQVTYSNLASDLSVSAPTIKSWIELLEKLYLVFIVKPFGTTLAKSIRKEPKCYFFDSSAAQNGDAARLENVVALALLKWCDFQRDSNGRDIALRYFRDSIGREVDFILAEGRKVLTCIEVKTADATPSQSLKYLSMHLKPCASFQLVQELEREGDFGTIKIRKAASWLEGILHQLEL